MARSNKPLIWLPFAAGGTVAAFIIPAIMLVVLVSVLAGGDEHALAFERISAFVAHPLVRIALLFALGLPLWHAAHRLRMTLQDLGVRKTSTRRLVARICYASAAVISLILLYLLLPVS